MNNEDEFVIENGVLRKYVGNDTLVHVPAGITEIGFNAFKSNSSLTTVIIPDSVMRIGYGAFSGCESLSNISLTDNIREIGNYAFFECISLENISIPKGMEQIGKCTFKSCSSLSSITIPKEVLKIEESAFEDCTSLSSIIFQEGLIEIGEGSFRYCDSVVRICLPDSIERVGDSAFTYCGALVDFIIPDKTIEITANAFYGCKTFSYNLYDNAKYIGNDCNPYVVLVEAVSKNIESCVLAPTTRVIGKDAFFGCEELTSISFPDSVRRIGKDAFSDCSSLIDVTIPEGVEIVDQYCFENCKGLKQILNYSKAVVQSKKNAADLKIIAPHVPIKNYQSKIAAAWGFLNATELFSDKISKEYGKSLGRLSKSLLPLILQYDYAYGLSVLATYNIITVDNYENDYLKPAQNAGAHECVAFLLDWSSVHITASERFLEWERQISIDPFDEKRMKKLWDYEKVEGQGLTIRGYKGTDTSVSIPERIGSDYVTGIGKFAFRGRQELVEVSIPSSITKIERSAFEGCSSILEVSLPSSITKIGRSAFEGCSSMFDIKIPKNVSRIEAAAFRNCFSLTSITFHDQITDIGEYAFENCRSLETVILPNGIKRIGQGAFWRCSSLSDITIPESVLSIGPRAYDERPSLVVHVSEGSYAEGYAKRSLKIQYKVI